MKNLIFMVIFCSICVQNSFSEKYTQRFRIDTISETDTEEISAGIKINSKEFNAVLGARSFDLSTKKFSENKKNLNSAAQIGSMFYIGTLSFSNSISRLKNPLINVSSPLKNSVWFTPGINCSLPQYNGSPKPVSAAVIFPNAEIAVTEENEIYASIHSSFPSLGKKSSIAFTGGIFNHNKDFKNSWFNESKWYGESGFISCSMEFNLHSKYFETSILAGSSENPFGGFFYYISTQNSLIIDSFRLNFALYQGDEGLITAEGHQPKTKTQLELNPQFILKFKKSVFRAGILSHAKFKTEKNEYDSKAGLHFQTSSFQAGLSAACSYKTENGFFEYGAGISFIKYTKHTSWNTKFSYKNEKLIKNTYSLTNTLKFKCSLSPEISASCTATEKNGTANHKITISASIQKKSRNINASFRISYDTAF